VRFVEEGEYLTVFLPALQRALVFRVKARVNRGLEEIDYGPLPLKAGDILPTYDGGSVSVPADGVLPGRAYTGDLSFPYRGVFDETDMWYTPPDYRDRLLHVVQEVTPGFVRVEVRIPKGVAQGRFQRNKLVTGVDKDFGFARGRLEVVHLPGVRYGFRYGNDTNADLATFVRFEYAEYEVEVPRSPHLVFDILVRRVPSYWLTLPYNATDRSVNERIEEAYGFLGFPLYRIDQREEALREYSSLLEVAKV